MPVAPRGVRPIDFGVRPDYVIHVRPDILYEIDGPMLRHGLQGLQGQRIVVPSQAGGSAG